MAEKKTARGKTGPKTNWKLTDEVVRKLEEAAAIDATVEEMCFYADISRDTFYRWVKENPTFSDRINRLRERPVLVARQTVVKAISNDPKLAMDYLKAKKRGEFASRQELTGKDGDAIQVQTFTDLIREAVTHHADNDSHSTTSEPSP